jgi:plastocyanin
LLAIAWLATRTCAEVIWHLNSIQAGGGDVFTTLGVHGVDILTSGSRTNAAPGISVQLRAGSTTNTATLLLKQSSKAPVTRAQWRFTDFGGFTAMDLRLQISSHGYSLRFLDPSRGVPYQVQVTDPAQSGAWDGFFKEQWTGNAVVTLAGQSQFAPWTVTVGGVLVTSLTATAKITFTEQPQSVTAPLGTNVTFRLAATVTGVPADDLRYQWQRDGADLAGATNATYRTPAVQAADHSTRYRCLVSLANGPEEATSQEATLSVVGATAREVLIRSFGFHPDSLVLNPGDSVRWTNADVAVHTTTSDSGVWSSPGLSRGSTFTFTFTNSGVFRYHSAPQPYMEGKIIVQQAPSVKLLSPATNALFVAAATVTLSAEATDADGTIKQVEFFSGSTLVGTDTTAPFDLTLTNLASGNYTVSAKATDNRRASATSAAVGFLVDAPPAVRLTSPTNGTILLSPGPLRLEAAATDSDGQVAKLEFFLSDGAMTNSLASRTSPPFSLSVPAPPAGVYRLFAQATDNLGVQATSAPVEVIVRAVLVLMQPKFDRTEGFHFVISNATAGNYVIEVTTDLSAQPVWLPLRTNALTGVDSPFTDAEAIGLPRRFYRVRHQP